MWQLVAATLFTAAADSLNPIALTQQFVLQGMVRRPGHIWYFILPTGIVNFCVGLLVYFGLAGVAAGFFEVIIDGNRNVFVVAAVALGALLIAAAVYFVLRYALACRRTQYQNSGAGETVTCTQDISGRDANTSGSELAAKHLPVTGQHAARQRVRSVSPLALVALGSAATLSELATAMPYFAFLAIIFASAATPVQVIALMVVYNIIYMSPLMALYFVYRLARDSFDRLYSMLKRIMVKGARVLLPLLLAGGGALLMRWGLLLFYF